MCVCVCVCVCVCAEILGGGSEQRRKVGLFVIWCRFPTIQIEPRSGTSPRSGMAPRSGVAKRRHGAAERRHKVGSANLAGVGFFCFCFLFFCFVLF